MFIGEKMNALSLFSCSGIGDIGLSEAGVSTVVANELLSNRCEIMRTNFPNCNIIEGDIWVKKQQIIDACSDKDIEIILATPPCQGMSSNGAGKLLSEIRLGRRPKFDQRNRLIIPTVEIISEIKPKMFILENVAGMERTVILDDNGISINILDYVRRELPEFSIQHRVLNFPEYGLPQNRKRLITIGVMGEHKFDFFPESTHSTMDESLKPYETVRSAIGHFSPISAIDGENDGTEFHPYHKVAILDEKKYWWISNTPPEKGAFDNQCIDESCGYLGNQIHRSEQNSGINRASISTPIYCSECQSLLPRPTTFKNGEHVLMKGFTSAYRRMKWDSPATTITQNLAYACSDKKLHPEQNRVLSIAEAMKLQTIPDSFVWKCTSQVGDVSEAKVTLIRESIGESVPPMMIQLLIETMIEKFKTTNYLIQ